jgi:FkbM family methyltransferase
MSEHAAMYENQHLRLKQCRRGVMMYFANDKYVGRSFDLYGEFSEGEIALFGQILKPGMTVVDAGANIGAHTVYFAKAVGPKGLVLAFEPQPVIHHMLCGNIALNLLHNTRAFNIGLGKEMTGWRPPTIDYSLGANFGGISIETSSGGQTVEIRTLDTFNLAACHMIKIDVEGMERDVLIGAEATIAKHRPIMTGPR